jgi:hypothetical protein
MSNTLFYCLALFFTLFLLRGEGRAQTFEDFDTDPNWSCVGAGCNSYDSHSYSNPGDPVSFECSFGLRENTTTQDGEPSTHSGANAWRLEDDSGSEWRAIIPSGGVDTFSVWVRRWNIGLNYICEYSTNNGSSYTPLVTIDDSWLNNSSAYKKLSGTINSTNNDIIIRIRRTSGERLMIDDFGMTQPGGSPTLSPGDLVITEILYNPSPPSEASAEWIELYNNSGSSIDLNGLTIQDASTSSTITSSYTLPSGQYAVIGRIGGGGCATLNGTYNSIILNNGAETVSILDGATTIDVVSYNTINDWPGDEEGEAIQLDPTATDATSNDDGLNWCHAYTPCSSDFGTPGTANNSCTCGITSLSAASFSCLTNTAGPNNDGVLIEIPYSGSDPNAGVINNAGGVIIGDNPATTPNGTIQITGLSEGGSWDISITGGPCSNLNSAGTVPATQCDPFTLTGGGMIVNEVGNLTGVCCPTSNVEFIELLVVGDPGAPLANVDLTGWIIDDNNGDFEGLTTGVGNTSGHIRLEAGCFTSIPPGSLIVIYNDDNFCNAGLYSLTDDFTDSNADGVYVFPISNSCFGVCGDFPCFGSVFGGGSCPVATTSYGIGSCTYQTSVSCKWEAIPFRNSGDVAQVRKPDGTFFHGFAYGDVNAPFPTFPNGNSAFNAGSGDDTGFDQCENATVSTAINNVSNTQDDPNSPDNAFIIAAIQNGTIDYDKLLGTGSPTNCADILPVELLYFSAEQQQEDVLLRWRTLSEQNNDRFVVERSYDGKDFNPIGEVKGFGTTSTPVDYRYRDQHPPAELLYYRLRQLDYDGSISYSAIKSVLLYGQAGWKLAPKLATHKLTLFLDSPLSEPKRALLFNAFGQPTGNLLIPAQISRWDIPLEHLPSGIYFLRFQDKTKKFVKK